MADTTTTTTPNYNNPWHDTHPWLDKPDGAARAWPSELPQDAQLPIGTYLKWALTGQLPLGLAQAYGGGGDSSGDGSTPTPTPTTPSADAASRTQLDPALMQFLGKYGVTPGASTIGRGQTIFGTPGTGFTPAAATQAGIFR